MRGNHEAARCPIYFKTTEPQGRRPIGNDAGVADAGGLLPGDDASISPIP
jgi:hypothetical protein